MEREIIEEGLTLKLVKESENYVRYKVTDKYEYEAYYLDIWNDYEEYDEDECDRDDEVKGWLWCLNGKHGDCGWETFDFPADNPEQAIHDAISYILALREDIEEMRL